MTVPKLAKQEVWTTSSRKTAREALDLQRADRGRGGLRQPTGNDGMIVGAALGVEVVEAMVWRRWSSSACVLSMSIHVNPRTSARFLLVTRPRLPLPLVPYTLAI